MYDGFHLDLQLFQRPRQLVRAAGAATLAVDAFQARDDIAHAHSPAEGSDALRVAVAAPGIADLPDEVSLRLDVDLLRADDVASPERRLPDAAFGAVTQFLYFVHSHSFSHRQRYKTLWSCRRCSARSEMDLIWT